MYTGTVSPVGCVNLTQDNVPVTMIHANRNDVYRLVLCLHTKPLTQGSTLGTR